MSLILDLSVVVLMLTVLSCLALLTWTLAVSSVRASVDAEEGVRRFRGSVAVAHQRTRTDAARANATLAELANRTTPPGDRSDR